MDSRKVQHGIPKTEREMVEVLLSALPDVVRASQWGREIRSHGRSRVDLCLYAADELIAVEVKKSDWKRVIAQATLNRYCVDRSYVALWLNRISDQLIAEARLRGVGVMSFDSSDVMIVEHAPLARPNPMLRQRMLVALPDGSSV